MTTQQIRLQSSCFAGHKCLVNTVGFAGHKLSGEYLCKALALLAINVWWIPTTRSTSARLFVGWTHMLTQCFGFHVLALAKPDACATHCLSTLSLYSIVWRGLQCFAGHAPGEALAKLWLCWSYMPVYTPLHSGKSYMRWHHFTVVSHISYSLTGYTTTSQWLIVFDMAHFTVVIRIWCGTTSQWSSYLIWPHHHFTVANRISYGITGPHLHFTVVNLIWCGTTSQWLIIFDVAPLHSGRSYFIWHNRSTQWLIVFDVAPLHSG